MDWLGIRIKEATMLPFLLLVLTGPYLITGLLQRLTPRARLAPRTRAKLGVTALFLVTSTAHFTSPDAMAAMLPDFVPRRGEIIQITGLLEILGAAGIWVPGLTRIVGALLILMLVGMLPANVYSAFARVPFGGHELGPIYLFVRVPFQLLLIGWVYFATGQKWLEWLHHRRGGVNGSKKTAAGQAGAEKALPHVVILGGGFAGINAARALRDARVRITIVDRQNHHLFQPLLYQVATASLSPADIARPIRDIFRRQSNVEVWMGEVVHVDPSRRRVCLPEGELEYDYLVVATGASHGYFSHPEWASVAPGLKTVDDALEIRRRFLLSFEAAEREADPVARRRLLTFVIVGGGATGVELAGAMAEIARKAIPRDFRYIDTATARVVLIEGTDRVLPNFPAGLSSDAERQLRELGVEVLTGTVVTGVDAEGVDLSGERIEAANVFWAAGVVASPVGAGLGATQDRAGRVSVASDLSLPGHPEVFVTGDLARVEQDGITLPGVAQVAIQTGRHAAEAIRADLDGRARSPFHYRDLGSLATIGRSAAVADFGRVRLSGAVAWWIWAVVHVFQLTGFRNRLLVMIQWTWSYFTFQRGIRLITGAPAPHLERPRKRPARRSLGHPGRGRMPDRRRRHPVGAGTGTRDG
jgi:NADH dehydrogenase